MKTRFENMIALILSAALFAVPLPVLARGFGGGGGHSFGGGGFGGGHSFGGGGSHSFGGGFAGGDSGFGGSHGFGNGQGFSGSHGMGSGSGFGGDKGFGNNQGFAGNKGFGNGSGFGGNQGFGNHGTGFGGNQGFGGGGGFAGNKGFGNRPGFDGFGGNKSGFGSGSFSGNHPNYGHFPSEGGFSGISGNLNHTPHNFNQGELNEQGKSIRNSFNSTTVNNFSHNGNFNGYHNGYRNGYYHGYANGYYHGSWGYPGAWGCAGWSEAMAWTFMGVSTLTSFLGLAMIASSGHHGSSNNNGGGNVTNITYEGDNVYINGQPNCSAAQYYTQAQNLAAQAYTQPNTSTYADFYNGFPNGGQPTSTTTAPDEKWEPLGVFALAEPGETQSNMLLQLAINQSGIVRGNYMNQLTDEKSQVYGALDKKTQRVSWTIGQNKNTVFDTSLGTLCDNDSQVLVHYGPDNTQEMALIRLSQSGSGDGKDSNSNNASAASPKT